MFEDHNELFARNLAYFRKFSRELADALAAPQQFPSMVRTQDGDWDVDLGQGKRLYGKGARQATAEQMAGFAADPSRNTWAGALPGHVTERHLVALADATRSECARQGVTPRTTPSWSPIVIAAGIGPGLHLQALIEATDCRLLILVEPHVQMLRLSLFCLDWEAFTADMQKADRTFQLVVNPDPAGARQGVLKAIRTFQPGLLDGTRCLVHYNSPALDRTVADLVDHMQEAAINFGFLDDEYVMSRNTLANAKHRNARLLVAQSGEMPPAIIVGSGPSYDQARDMILRESRNALIISCGTALRQLLAAGIKPDFHVELENVEITHKLVAGYRATYDLSGITLVASTTVTDRLASLFDRQIFFYRAGPSSELMCPNPPTGLLGNVHPLVSNTALSFAMAIGCREILLCGIDLGTKNKARHHSAESLYTSGDLPYNWDLHTAVPGNFGGDVFTEQEYLLSKSVKENTIRAVGAGRKVYNCSDGVAIVGAPPLRPEDVQLAPGPGKSVADQLWSRLPAFSVGGVAGRWEGPLAALRPLCDTLRTPFAKVRTVKGLRAALTASSRTVAQTPDEFTFRMLRGSVLYMISTAAHFACRLDAGRAGDAVAARIASEFRAALSGIESELGQFLRNLAQAEK